MSSWLLALARDPKAVLSEAKWVREAHDGKTYRLQDTAGNRSAKVWKSGASWACLDGTSWRTLSEAKANTEENVTAHFYTRMEELLSRFSGLADGASRDEMFPMLKFERNIFSRLMSDRVSSAYNEATKALGLARLSMSNGGTAVEVHTDSAKIILADHRDGHQDTTKEGCLQLSKLVMSVVVQFNDGRGEKVFNKPVLDLSGRSIDETAYYLAGKAFATAQ